MSYSINQFHYAQRQIYLSSKWATLTADNDFNSHCWFSLQEAIVIPRGYQNILVSVDDAQFPMSFYSVNETNNKFSIFRNGVEYVVTIPFGNYDAYTLCQAANDIITDLLIGFGVSFDITYDITTNKFQFEIIGVSYIGYSLKFTGFSYILFGFTDSITQYIFESSILISPKMIDLSGTRFLFVQSPTFSTVNINSKSGSTNQILAKIPITQDYLGIQQYVNNGFQNKITLNAMHLSVIEIKILDEYLNLINLNGADWSITLNVTILGKSPEELIIMKPSDFSGE
jgi:hypothetical protein